MIVVDQKIEALFVDNVYFRQKIGQEFIDFAIKNGANLVDVNEQNPNAI